MSDLLNKASLVVIPSGYKEDTVYSVVPSDGSGDLSFTRASNGTRVNSAGLVEVVAWNLLEESERLSNWNLQGTSVTSDSTTAPNGTTTADTIIESNTTDEHNRYLEPNIGGGVFTYSIYLKRFNTDWSALYVFNTAVGGVRHWVNLSTLTAGTSANIGSGIGTTSLSLENVGNGWVRASISFTNPSGSCRFYVANAQSNGGATSYAGNGTNGIYAWGGQVNIGSTAKPYFPTTDRLNVPRLTYQNGGGGCPSLLLEKQSTNLVSYSEDFTNSYWGLLNSTITPNNTISPDGTQNADKFVENNGTGEKWIYSTPIVTAGSVYTYSIFAKKGERDFIYINAYSNANLRAWFNLNTGTIGATDAGVSAKIENYGNGWYKCSVTITVVTGVQFYLLGVSNANNVVDYSGNGTSGIYIWGAQGEQSSYPTSYIPTTSASATRVADACFKTGISSLIGQTEGTLFCEINTQQSPANNWFQITDGTANNWVFIGLDQNSLRGYVRLGSSTVFSDTSFNFTNGVTYKMALRYKSGDIALYINGNAIASNAATYTVSASISQVIFGDLTNPPNDSAKYSQAIIFPTALTNAELAQLTA